MGKTIRSTTASASVTRRRTMMAAAAAALSPTIVRAQGQWPTRQVRIIVPYPPAGPTDLTARIVLEKAGSLLGHQFVIENKGGASGAIGAELAKRAAPDGTTFLATTTAMVCITPHLQPLPYAVQDFVPVARMATSWVGMGVHPSIPARTLDEFVAYAKQNPGKINFGSAGLATITHLYGEMLKLEAGIDMVHVPYKGSAAALQDLLGGQVQAQFDPLTLPQIKAGRIRGLAIVGEQRWPGAPDVPTLREAGYGKNGGDAWYGILAPVGIPQPIVERLAGAIGEALQSREVQEKLIETAHFGSFLPPAAFGDTITRESAAFADVIRRGNIRV